MVALLREKAMLTQFKTLSDLMIAFRDPQTAIDHFKAIRWADGVVCPYCDHDKAYDLSEKNKYKCADCSRKFSVLVGTIFENTKLPLRVWFGAIWLITNHPKGIASTTLAKDLGITQKSAWFVLHRLRHAARTRSFNKPPMSGKVEIDETYVGGKAINRHKSRSGTKGGVSDKTPVIGAVERDGEVIAKVLPVANKTNMHEFVKAVVDPQAEMLATDAHPVYQRLEGYPQHQIVNHQQGEFKRGEAHTNSIESVWALLKRQIVGTHHWVSPKHLEKYVQEMTWRLNRRSMTPADRMNDLFESVAGALPYKVLIS
jgi:transposase-like protein/IS1 family transposase